MHFIMTAINLINIKEDAEEEWPIKARRNDCANLIIPGEHRRRKQKMMVVGGWCKEFLILLRLGSLESQLGIDGKEVFSSARNDDHFITINSITQQFPQSHIDNCN